jgi:hypothetical protein
MTSRESDWRESDWRESDWRETDRRETDRRETETTNPKDPAVALTVLWQSDYDRYEAALRAVAQREQETFDARPEDQEEAILRYMAAAKFSGDLSETLERFKIAIFRTKAQSLEGIAAKLAVAIRDGTPSPRSDEPPWPYLRSIQADLERLRDEVANRNGASR